MLWCVCNNKTNSVCAMVFGRFSKNAGIVLLEKSKKKFVIVRPLSGEGRGKSISKV